MNWILDHFQFVIIIVAVVVSLVKRVLEAKNAERDAPYDGDVFEPAENRRPASPPPRPFVPPPLAQPSPPITRRSAPPPQVERNDEAELLQRQQDMQERLRRIKETRSAASNPVPLRKSTSVKPAQAGLRGALREPRQMRRAIVLREILGPPVGLR